MATTTDIALGNRSESSGKFNFVIDPITHDVQFDDTQEHLVMTSCMEQRAGYWANPNTGSLVYQIKNLTSRTPSQAQAAVLEALQRSEQAGYISNVQVQATTGLNNIGGGFLGIDVYWTTAQGPQGPLSL